MYEYTTFKRVIKNIFLFEKGSISLTNLKKIVCGVHYTGCPRKHEVFSYNFCNFNSFLHFFADLDRLGGNNYELISVWIFRTTEKGFVWLYIWHRNRMKMCKLIFGESLQQIPFKSNIHHCVHKFESIWDNSQFELQCWQSKKVR